MVAYMQEDMMAGQFEMHDQKALFKVPICNRKFWIEFDPFGTFPKMHPIWQRQPSLILIGICHLTSICVQFTWFAKSKKHRKSKELKKENKQTSTIFDIDPLLRVDWFLIYHVSSIFVFWLFNSTVEREKMKISSVFRMFVCHTKTDNYLG